MDLSWTATTDEVLNHFKISSKNGLSPEQVALHSEQYGTNGGLVLLRAAMDILLTT